MPTEKLDFSGGSEVNNLPAKAGNACLIPGVGRSPAEGNGNQLQYSWPGKSHGQRSLVGYSPWGSKELDMTELLNKTSKGRETTLAIRSELGIWKDRGFVCSLKHNGSSPISQKTIDR